MNKEKIKEYFKICFLGLSIGFGIGTIAILLCWLRDLLW
jgi:hypothetical protein|tara:strand:- start:1059 stop:1175 length:117 start_codon:yes stop_codon:yes gene_type:complete